jgi:hypothetical protein
MKHGGEGLALVGGRDLAKPEPSFGEFAWDCGAHRLDCISWHVMKKMESAIG